jgi:hypothetical protein
LAGGGEGWRGVAGSPGKNITVSANGDAIAVCYTGPTDDPNNFQAFKIAYSVDDGATWTPYGPFSPDVRRCYPGLTGTPDFDSNFGELWFIWHETIVYDEGGNVPVMIEEGTPATPAPDGGNSLPQSSGPDSRFWLPSIAVSPDDPMYLAATAFNAHPAGDADHMAYYWISTDGGYAWTDSMNLPIDSIPTGDNGPFAAGPGDYLFYHYHNDFDYAGVTGYSIYFIESTDWGTTWSTPEALQPATADTLQTYWWYEFDNLIINGEPWMFDMDIGSPTAPMWMWHATGSPGAWTWDYFDGFVTGSVDEVVGDTHYVCVPWEFCQLSYDAVNDIILGGFLAQFIKVHVPTDDTVMNGFYAGGIYSMDGGSTWENAAPLSDLMETEPNVIFPVEFAHRIVDGYTYCIWLPGASDVLYFDRGYIQPFTGVAESGSNHVIISDFQVTPTIAPNLCRAAFTMPVSGRVALRMFDVAGRLVETVFDGHLNKGSQEFDVRTSQLANGTYFLILETNKGKDVAKIITTH